MEQQTGNKGTPPRYDEAFKAEVVRMVMEQGQDPKEIIRDLGIRIDTLRNWMKSSGMQMRQVSRYNGEQQRIQEVEEETRSLRKQLIEKRRSSISHKIRRYPVETIVENTAASRHYTAMEPLWSRYAGPTHKHPTATNLLKRNLFFE